MDLRDSQRLERERSAMLTIIESVFEETIKPIKHFLKSQILLKMTLNNAPQ